MHRPTPIGKMHEIFALVRDDMRQGDIAAGLVWLEKPLIASSWCKLPLLVWN